MVSSARTSGSAACGDGIGGPATTGTGHRSWPEAAESALRTRPMRLPDGSGGRRRGRTGDDRSLFQDLTSLEAASSTAFVAPLSRRWVGLAAVVLWSGTIVALAAGCNHTECTGDVYCPNFPPDKCVNIPGCTATPACLNEVDQVPGMSSCSKYTTATSCPSPACAWIANSCIDTCTTQLDSSSCYAVPLVHDAGGNLVFGCYWYLCSGTAKNVSCGEFSIESCPADRCSVRTFCDVFPDC